MIGIAKTLKLSFAVGALLLFCSSLLTIYNANRWSSEGLAVAQARAALSQLQELQAGLIDAESSQRAYLLTHSPAYLSQYEATLSQSRASLANLPAHLLSSSPGLKLHTAEKMAELSEIVALARANRFAAALAIVETGRGQALTGRFRQAVAAAKAVESRELAKSQQQLRATRSAASFAAISGSILAFVALVFAGWRSHYDLVRRQGAERSLGLLERRFDAFMHFNPCLAFIKDSQGRMIFVNAAVEKAFDIRFADWQGRDDFSIWPRHVAEALRATDLKVLAGNSTLEVIETVPRPDGTAREFLSVKFPFSVPGSERFLGGIAFDITDRRAAEVALQQSETFNRGILESSQDCIKILSLQGELLFMNTGGQKQLGICNFDPLLNACWLDFWKGEHRAEATKAMAAAASGQIGRFEGFCPTFTGQSRWWHVVISPILDSAGNPERLLCISRDITELKLAEKKVAESEARYRELFDRNPLPAWIYSTDTFRFLDVNQTAADHYGYSHAELLSLGINDIRVPDQMQSIEDDLVDAIATNRRSGPWLHRRKDGSLVTVEITCHPVDWLDRPARLIMVHDVSERVASETRFRLLFEESTDARFLLDERGIFDCNHAAVRILGVPDKDSLFGLHPGFDFSPAFQPCGRSSADLVAEYNARLDCEACVRFDWLIHRADGSPLPVEVALSRVQVNGHTFRISTWNDLTERSRAADHVRASLVEKEVLLREIHHRVKNNLQVICSLLSMQSQTISHPGTLEVLRESQDRVQSMAMIHELLYSSASLSDIDFADYAGLLAAELSSSLGLNRARVHLVLQVQPIRFSLDQAVPCGLILNELVSNAFKYAYPSPAQGEIRIGLHQDEALNIHLSVTDDGAGLPAGFNLAESRSLGLRIVNILARQLGGSMNVFSERGSAFEVVFPALIS